MPPPPPPPQPSQSSAATAPSRAQSLPDDALSISHETVSILTVNPDRQAVLINDQPPDYDSPTLLMLKPGDSIQLDGERQPSARPNEIRFLRSDRSGSDEARGAASSWSRLRRSWCRVDAETSIVRDGETTPIVANELHLIGPMQEAKVGSSLCYSPADQVICVYSLAEQQRQQVVWVDPYETVLVNELPVTVQPGEPVRLQPADRVSFVNSAEQSARPTGQQPRLLEPLDFRRCRRATAVPLDRETVVTVNFRSRLLRAGDAMYLGEGETYSLQGATQSLADGEVVVFWNTQDRPVRSDSSATAERSSEMAASSTTIDAVPAEEARALTEEQIDERVTSMHGKLRAKEAELKRTLTRQEEFNERLRTVAMRMDSTKQSLDSLDPRNAASLDECTTEHENLMIEVEVISQEIDSLVRLGLELCESSSKDDEEAMQKSLTALQKKEKSLKDLAEQKKKKILQTARDRERHQNARTRLLDDTGRLEAWASQAETRLAQSVSSAADPDAAIEACRSINSELNSRLQELSDAQVHYNQLCEFESPDERRPIENRLHALQEAMEALKNDCIERQVALREAAKAAERAPPAAPAGADAAADAESVDSTEYRVRRQQQHAEAAEIGRQRRAAEEGLAMRLQSGIQDHHSLIQSLGNDFERLELSDEPVYDDSDELQAQLDEQLSNISRHIRRRRDETVQAVDSGTRPASLQAVDPSESPTKASLELNNALSQLSAAMTRLSRQSATESQQIQSQGRQEQQRRYQAALLAVSSALDGVESRLFRSQTDSIESGPALDILLEELSRIRDQSQRLSDATPAVVGSLAGGERAADLAMESVADLDGRLSLLEQCAQRRQARLNECQREWRGFKDEIARVRAQLEASRRQYEASRDSSAPVEQQMRDSQLLEATIRQYEAKLAELTRKGGRILERAPQFSEADRSGELQSLRIDWEELRVRVTERRQELHRIQTSQAQYEQMLHSWAEYLETAESKLAEASLTAADSADVRRQQQQHRAFFEGLETHEATLEQARRRLDPREAARHSVQHARLGQVARAVKLAAAQRTNQMETLAQDWAELDDRLAQLDAWVAGAADRLAEIRSQPPAADEAAEERRLSGLQELASSLRGRRSAVFQLVDRGRLLLGRVACPRLETALSDLAERWVQLTDSVEDQLSVAEDRRRVGEEFAQHLADVSDCLQRAEVELESATEASGAAAAEEASLEDVRGGLERLCTVAQLLESRQRERRLLHDLVAGSPSALASTTSRRRRAEEFEAAWVGLERRWRALETRLQRRERELTPSHEALLGLRDWLSGFESRLASASRRTLHSRAETEALAAEFQSLRVELSTRSPTLAFVRESFAELRLAQSDAREFESLTRLGADFDRASDSVASIATSLEAFARRWAAVDDRGSGLTARLKELKARVAGLGEIGHEEGARFAAREAEATGADLAALEPQLAALETEARSLLTEEAGASGCLGCDSLIVNPQCMRELLQRLAQELALVNNQLTQVKSRLANALAQWESHSRAQQAATQLLAEVTYLLDRNRLAGGELPEFVASVERLSELAEHLRTGGDELGELARSSDILSRLCEPAVARSLEASGKDFAARWRQAASEASERAAELSRTAGQWKAYNDALDECEKFLAEQERSADRLMRGDGGGLATQPLDPAALLSRCRVLDSELDAPLTARLRRLAEARGSGLSGRMESSNLSAMAAAETAIDQRRSALRSVLKKFQMEVDRSSAQRKRFFDMFNSAQAFLDSAESCLAQPDPEPGSGDSIEDTRKRLCELLGLTDLFAQRQYQIDRLGELGQASWLGESDVARVRQLSQQWQRLMAQCLDRSRALQASVLVQETFLDKVTEWRQFLDAAQRDLAPSASGAPDMPPVGGEPALQRQQAALDSFLHRLVSRQQVLQALLADGGAYLRRCADPDVRAQLAEKLESLEQQWNAVCSQARQRKASTDAWLAQWQSYQALLEGLMNWLADTEDRLDMCRFSVASVQKVRILAEQLRLCQASAGERAESHARCRDMAKQLAEMSGQPTVRAGLEARTAELDARWQAVNRGLTEQLNRLDNICQLWTEADEGVRDCLAWLREVRLFAEREAPTAFDELHAEAQRCRKEFLDQLYDYLKTFESTSGVRDRLRDKERQLRELVSAEDIHLLHQRTVLLEKLWDELHHRLLLKEDRLQHGVNEWREFNDRYDRLMEWLTGMEAKVSVSQDYQVEDLIDRIASEYKAEIAAMQSAYNETLECGRALLSASSEVRSRDIQFKLQRLDDRWQSLQLATDDRLARLRDTLDSVRQLELSMQKLRGWLLATERELQAKLVYEACDFAEIQRKTLAHQKLQSEIESRSAGIQAVINLCELLMYERDACPTEQERLAIQRAMRSLEQRWRRICQRAMERRLEIEETWRCWQKMRDTLRQLESAVSGLETDLLALHERGDDIDSQEEELNELRQRLDALTAEASALSAEHRQLAGLGRTDARGESRAQLDRLDRRLDSLAGRLTGRQRRGRGAGDIRRGVDRLRGQLRWALDDSTGGEQSREIRARLETQLKKLEYVEQASRFLLSGTESGDPAALGQELDKVARETADLMGRMRGRRGSGDGEAPTPTPTPAPMRATIAASTATAMSAADNVSVYSDRTEDLLMAAATGSVQRGGRARAIASSSSEAKLERVERVVNDLERLLDEVDNDLEFGEARLRATPTAAEEAELVGPDTYTLRCPPPHRRSASRSPVRSHFSVQTRLFTACRSKIDRIRELERRLREVASAEGLAGADSGATNGVDEESRAGRVIARWRRLLAEATQRDAQLAARSGSAASLEHEAERMSEWLAATLRELQQQPTVPSSTAEDGDLANVEASARRLKELVDRLERHKSAAMSLQLCLRRPDLSERQRGRIADCLSLWRQAYAEARRRHRRLQSSFAGCAQLSDRLAEISRGVAEARQLALENRPRLSDTAAQLAAKATGAAAAEARVAKAAELVRKWAGYAAVVLAASSFDHGAAAGESVAAPAAGSPEMAKVAGQLTRLEAELADALRRLRAVKRELALRESSYERLDSVDAVASVPRVEDADADYYDDEPGSAAATAAAAAAAAAKLRVASSSGVGRRRGSLLNTLYRGMLLSLPIEAFFLLLCGIGYLLKPGCETDCSEWPNMFSVKSQGLPY